MTLGEYIGDPGEGEFLAFALGTYVIGGIILISRAAGWNQSSSWSYAVAYIVGVGVLIALMTVLCRRSNRGQLTDSGGEGDE